MASKTAAEYKAEYKRLAKMIDQRMRTLERAGSTQYAYKGAQRAFARMFPGPSSGKPRFEKVPKTNDIRKLRGMINELKNIKEMTSSTIPGLKSISNKAAKTLNRKYGLDISGDQLGAFFESAEYKKMVAEGYGSDTIVKAIGYIRNHRDKIEKAIEQHKQFHVHGNYKDVKVKEFIETRIDLTSLSFDDLMSGFGL